MLKTDVTQTRSLFSLFVFSTSNFINIVTGIQICCLMFPVTSLTWKIMLRLVSIIARSFPSETVEYPSPKKRNFLENDPFHHRDY